MTEPSEGTGASARLARLSHQAALWGPRPLPGNRSRRHSSDMGGFRFHPELFEVRSTVIGRLSDYGLNWFTDYMSVDILHAEFGIEVGGIQQRATLQQVRRLLQGWFPAWRYGHTQWNVARESIEPGWKVSVHRNPPDEWKSYGVKA